MEDEPQKEMELAEHFFNQDAKNKIQVIEGFQELIEVTDDISDIHRYARKIRKTEKDIEKMAKRAEKMIENDDRTAVDIQEAVQESLDTLHSSIEYQETSVGVNWDAENYLAELNPTVEKMLYNLFDNSIEHGEEDVEIEVTEYDRGLMIDVYDGGEVDDWDDIFPEDGETLDDYPSTGAYLIDRVAENNEIEISDSEDRSYSVKIPR